MTTMHYYRVATPEAIAAVQVYLAQRAQVHKEAEAFAAKYPGATALYRSNLHGVDFGGLVFEPPLTSPLWTHPSIETRVQRPRSVLPKHYVGDRATGRQELKALTDQWLADYPKAKADRHPLYEVAGTDWGAALFAGVAMAATNDALLLAIGRTLPAPAEELTATEWEQATKERAA